MLLCNAMLLSAAKLDELQFGAMPMLLRSVTDFMVAPNDAAAQRAHTHRPHGRRLRKRGHNFHGGVG